MNQFHIEIINPTPISESSRQTLFYPELPAIQVPLGGQPETRFGQVIKRHVDSTFAVLNLQAHSGALPTGHATNLCRVSQYCRLPFNTVRTRSALCPSGLLRPEGFDNIAINYQYFLERTNQPIGLGDPIWLVELATALVEAIIEHALKRSSSGGRSPPAPTPGTWGTPLS